MTVTLQAGRLRSKILIQEKSTEPDPVTGRTGSTWATMRKTRAWIMTKTEKEQYLSGTYADEATHVVQVRWTPVPLRAGMQVVFGTRTFTVIDAENLEERNIAVNLVCVEIDGVIS